MRGAWALPTLIGNLVLSLSQREHEEEGFGPVRQKSLNAQNPRRRDEPRNCTKYLRELLMVKVWPKSSGVPSWGSGTGKW